MKLRRILISLGAVLLCPDTKAVENTQANGYYSQYATSCNLTAVKAVNEEGPGERIVAPDLIQDTSAPHVTSVYASDPPLLSMIVFGLLLLWALTEPRKPTR